MANTTLGNLKIGALRRAGNSYSSTDSTRLELAGGLINDCLGEIQAEVKESPYFEDIANTVNTTASQAYFDTTDTDIIEITSVYQITSDTKLTRIDRRRFVELQPDTTAFTGTSDMFYYPTQSLNVSGQNIWRIYLIPTPSSVMAMYFDYQKNIKFATEGSGGDASFCPLPTVFNELIYAMFRPKWYSITDPKNQAALSNALTMEQKAKATYYPLLKQSVDSTPQIDSMRNATVRTYPRAAKTV